MTDKNKRIPRVFQAIPLQINTEVTLDHAAARHLVQVLRLTKGAQICLFNNTESEYVAELQQATPKHCVARIIEARQPHTESLLQVHVGQAISRGDRMDYAIQKAVELGAASVVPVWTQRCQGKWDAVQQAKRLAHWQGIAVAASEQSGRTCVPAIGAPQPLADWLKQVQSAQRWVLTPHVDSVQPVARAAAAAEATLLIGPEGGLTDDEVALAMQHGFQPWQLGPRILRTETAVVVALSVLQFM